MASGGGPRAAIGDRNRSAAWSRVVREDALWLVLAGLAFAGSHQLGTRFLSPLTRVSAVWPASGVAIAALVLSPQRRWPALAAVIGAVSFLSNFSNGNSVLASAGFAVSNSLELGFGAWVFARLRQQPIKFDRLAEVVSLLVVATVGTASAAIVGALTASALEGAPFGAAYSTWWVANALGIVLVTPLVVSFARAPKVRASSERRLEAAAFLLIWCGAAWLAFHAEQTKALIPRPYALLALLAWAALRLGQRGVSAALAALAVIAVGNAAASPYSPLTGNDPTDRLVAVQIYLAITTITGLLLAASATETQAAEEDSRQNAERLRFALEAARMGNWEWNLATDQVFWSDAIEPLFGLEKGAFPGTFAAYTDLLHPEDRARVVAAIQAAARGEVQHFTIEHRVLWPDGSVHWLEGQGRLHQDLLGGSPRMIGTVADVSERKRAQAAVAAGEALLRQFIQHTPAAVAMFDTEMRYLYAAERWLTDYHLEGREIVGKSHYEVFPDIPDSWKEVHRRVLNGAVERCDEDPFPRADGALEWLAWEVRPWRKPAGEIGGLIMFTQVITARKLLQEQLRQTQKLEALGTLAGGIAHDFNNILSAIIAFTELSKMDNPGNRELQENLQEVLQACSRATNLVSQILSFSRQQQPERRRMPLTPVIGEALRLLRSSLPSTLEISQNLPRSLPEVLADGTQIHQVLMNLCTNAAHAMNGRGLLKVSLGVYRLEPGAPSPHLELRPGEYVRLQVSDTGRGMDSGTLNRIFEPFFTTKPPGAGTGLGLSVVHGIIKDHEGVITVESEPARGTTFSLYLPALSGETRVEREEPGGIPRGHGQRVLFVDDEPTLCDVAERFLLRLGYQAAVLRSSEQALRLLQSAPSSFAVVLTDLTMPGMTGIELIAEVRKLRPDIPVILSSGHTASLTSETIAQLGIREVLHKPLDYRSLGLALARSCATLESNPAPVRAAEVPLPDA